MFAIRQRLGRARNALLAISFAGVFATVAPAAASAAPPTNIPSTPQTYFFPAGMVCSFNLQAAEGPNQEVTRIYSSGRVSVTGQYKVTLTNMDTGASMLVNASGPFHISADGVLRETGRQLFLLFPGDFSGPGLFMFTGTVYPTRDDEGHVATITYTGTRSGNLCDALG
jgi:hypothetical protein